jgi:hypothetical protein
MKICPINGESPCAEERCAWWVEYKTTPTWNRCAVADIAGTLMGIYDLIENEINDRGEDE